ncbi:hypothetical protein K488DRAFT_24058, partial [Vararia minispora EC-137]
SSPVIRSAMWYSADFRLAAALIIIQPSTGKVVVVNDRDTGYWFVPRGRKDIGETVEMAALREGYEESGYRAVFLPLYQPTGAPLPPGTQDDGLRTGEPLFMKIIGQPTIVDRNTRSTYRRGDEYVCYYFVGQIPADAVREANTGMPDEASYVGELLDLDDAVARLTDPAEKDAVVVAYSLWEET